MMSTFLTVILRLFPFIFISIIIRCVYVNDKSHAKFVCGLIFCTTFYHWITSLSNADVFQFTMFFESYSGGILFVDNIYIYID